MLSKARAARLKPMLDAFVDARPVAERVAKDPVELPHRYSSARDIEVSALLAASLAYGRADLFKPKVSALLEKMGRSPAQFVEALTLPRARTLLEGFVYRFNLPADLGVLLLGVQRALREYGSLENLFVSGLGDDWHGALAKFTAALRPAPTKELKKALGPTRGLDHLLPHPLGKGAAKRLNLYLRWMVRGPDAIDFGIWKQVPASRLLMPVDTHIARIAVHLGLTKRTDLSWRTAEEITAGLRLLRPDDPVAYDFALCHYGMSGACPVRPVRVNCEACTLRVECRVGRRLTPG